MFDDEPPQLRAMLDRPDYEPPSTGFLLGIFAGVVGTFLLAALIHHFVAGGLIQALATIGSAL